MEMTILGQSVFAEFMAAVIAISALYVNWQVRRSTIASEKTRQEIDEIRTLLNVRYNSLKNDIRILQMEMHTIQEWRNSYQVSPWNTGKGVEEWILDHAREHEILRDKLEEDS